MSVALGLLHGLDFLLSSWLVGALVFYCLIAKAGGSEPESLLLNWPRRIALLVGLTFLSSLAWMLLTANDMAESWELSDLWIAMSQTRFGHVWCIRLALLFLLFIGIRYAFKTSARTLVFLCLTLLIPLFSSLTGHAGASESRVVLHVAVDWSHSIAVAVWTGGLWALRNWLGQRLALGKVGSECGRLVVHRFSQFAIGSTIVIAVTGIFMTNSAGVSFLQPWQTKYGLLVLGKLLFFCVALGAAAINQFLHLRNWNLGNDRQATLSVRREVTIELIFVLVIFGLAGFLTRAPLPGG